MKFIIDNIGTIIVLLVLLTALGLITRSVFKNFKNKKCSCDCCKKRHFNLNKK